MITRKHCKSQRASHPGRASRRLCGALVCGGMLATLGSSSIGAARAGDAARLRAMNFGMAELAWDIVNVSAPFCSSAQDTGSMRFERIVDEAMFAQLTAIRDAGGSVEIDFGTRIGNSFAGKGDGVTTGSVEVTIDGAAVVPALQYRSDVSGTTVYPEEIVLSDADAASLQVGSVINVTGTGEGDARANGCEHIDQAITSWYFTSRPIIQTYP